VKLRLPGKWTGSRSGSQPGILFHHIPKCGGTSLTETLYTWFVVQQDYEAKFANRAEYLAHPVSRDALNAETLLAGHWNEEGGYLSQRYPSFLKDPRLFRTCFLRDPLEVRLSLYYYNRSRPDCNEPAGKLELEEFLFARKNYLSKQFPCDETNCENILARYQFVGLVDHLKEDLAALLETYAQFLRRQPKHKMTARALCNIRNRPVVDVQHTNRSEAERAKVPASLKEKFIEENALDYELLRIARERAAARRRATDSETES